MKNQETLTEIGTRYGTDKASRHRYSEIYEAVFDQLRNDEVHLLEIGAGRTGASHKMWKEYFTCGEIYCMEAFYGQLDTVEASELERYGVQTLVGNQLKREDLSRAGEMLPPGALYDIIIDDGAHMYDAINISLGTLFPYLKSGGYYIIEDVFTARKRAGFLEDSEYEANNLEAANARVKPYGLDQEVLEHVPEYMLLESFMTLKASGQWLSKTLTYPENSYLSEHIAHWQFFDDQAPDDAALVIIRKK